MYIFVVKYRIVIRVGSYVLKFASKWDTCHAMRTLLPNLSHVWINIWHTFENLMRQLHAHLREFLSRLRVGMCVNRFPYKLPHVFKEKSQAELALPQCVWVNNIKGVEWVIYWISAFRCLNPVNRLCGLYGLWHRFVRCSVSRQWRKIGASNVYI